MSKAVRLVGFVAMLLVMLRLQAGGWETLWRSLCSWFGDVVVVAGLLAFVLLHCVGFVLVLQAWARRSWIAVGIGVTTLLHSGGFMRVGECAGHRVEEAELAEVVDDCLHDS